MLNSRHLIPVLLVAAVAACSSSGANDAERAGTSAPATTAPTLETSVPDTTAAPETSSPATIPTTTAAPTTTVPEPEPWAPVAAGPYAVGVETVTLDDPAGVRPLTVDVWFPIDTDVDTSTLAPQQYTLLPGVYYESPDAFAATVDQIASGEQLPLIVYSHGSNGLRYIHSSYTEALASHGYLVVAADHTGNTAVDYIADTRAPVPRSRWRGSPTCAG